MQEHLLSTLWGNRIGASLKSDCVITAQVVHWKSFGTYQLLALLFYLMLVYYIMLLGIQVVTLDILGVLYW